MTSFRATICRPGGFPKPIDVQVYFGVKKIHYEKIFLQDHRIVICVI